MVNTNNRIDGRYLTEHPLGEGAAEVYSKVGTVLAVQAPISGVVVTPEGEMRYQAGDWILTDNPPTHAWPVQDQIFRNTYVPIGSAEMTPVSEAVATPTIEKVARSAPTAKGRPKKAKVAPSRYQAKRGAPHPEPEPGKTADEVLGAPKVAVADSESLEALS